MVDARFFNRELSWLDFNARVLEEALDADNPALERLKFLAITSNNLDEFFMVRVGSLHLVLEQGGRKKDPAGLTPRQQLDRVSEKAHALVNAQYACWSGEVEPLLESKGIRRVKPEQINAEQRVSLARLFQEELYPVLTPAAVDTQALYTNLGLHLFIRLKNKPVAGGKRAAQRNLILPLNGTLDRFVSVLVESGYGYVLVEDVVSMFMQEFFPDDTVLECVPFRITRNADMAVQEEGAPDLLEQMSEVLTARKVSGCVRLELTADATKVAESGLKKLFRITDRELYKVDGPLNFADYFALVGLPGFDALRVAAHSPVIPPDLDMSKSMFPQIASESRLMHHPYDSFDPVVRLIEEAADDEQVIAIKQILYRTSKNSPIVNALMRAARNGKTVTVIVELKARFDEARNIEWAQAMEQEGVQVIYGVKGFKTHAKLLIIVRREAGGIRRYMHFGTGNYNEGTAKLYTDVSYLTCDPDLGADASEFFNTITGYSQPSAFRRIAAAPLTIRDTLVQQIRGEAERSRQGQKGHIMAKFNSLVDSGIIKELYEASNAGVKIELNVRGICCLVPGVKGLSENIRVVSVVDGFLEHSRIFWFRHGGSERVYISSADWMQRNLDKRVELMTPVDGASHQTALRNILTTAFRDNVKARELGPSGIYTRMERGRKKPVRSQHVLTAEAEERAAKGRRRKRTVFEPHRPSRGETK